EQRILHSFPTRRSSDLDRVVAASSLAAGTVLQAEHLAARAFPAELVPSDSWDVAQFENLLGQVLSQPLRAGDLISKAHVQEVSRSEEHTSELQSRENLV